MTPTVKRRLGWAGISACGLALGAIAPASWGEALASGGLALAVLAVGGAASAPLAALGYAWLAAGAVARGSPAVQTAAMVLGAAMVVALILRPGRWPYRLLWAMGLGGALAALLPWATSWLAGAPLDRAALLPRWPTLVACFSAALLFFSKEREAPAPRWLLVGGLAVASALGLLRLGTARKALDAAQQSGDVAAWSRAIEQARAIGWANGERTARLGGSRALLAAGDARAALDLLPPERVRGAQAQVSRAEALLALRDGSAAMDLLRQALAGSGGKPLETSDEAGARLGLWKARTGDHAGGLEALSKPGQVARPERYLAEAAVLAGKLGRAEEARRLAAQAGAADPLGAWGACALVEIDPSADPRRCLEVVPEHGPSLRARAQAGDAASEASLAAGAELPAREMVYGGVVALRAVRFAQSPVPPGGRLPVEALLEVLSNLAPGESYRAFVHLDGPTYREVEGAPAVDDWRRGVLHLSKTELQIPADLPPGSYRAYLGFQSRAGARLMPLGLPGHIQYLDVGRVEVRP